MKFYCHSTDKPQHELLLRGRLHDSLGFFDNVS